jgi:D-alanine-D-alanine ligase
LYAEWDTWTQIHAVRDAIAERFAVEWWKPTHMRSSVFARCNRRSCSISQKDLRRVAQRAAAGHARASADTISRIGPLTLATCLDKGRTKEVLAHHGVRTAPFVMVETMDELDEARVRFPLIVKPLHEGSSKGIYNSCVVRNSEELEREVQTILAAYHEPALVEEFLAGREFTVAILGNGNELNVLPLVEISFAALPEGMNPIYSYEAKWIWDKADNPLEIFSCPAHIPESLAGEIRALCMRTYRVLRCRDWSRIDVRLDRDGHPHILEVNPLPGILPRPEDNSCFPKAARAAGMSYAQLINEVLDIALARCGIVISEQPS